MPLRVFSGRSSQSSLATSYGHAPAMALKCACGSSLVFIFLLVLSTVLISTSGNDVESRRSKRSFFIYPMGGLFKVGTYYFS